LSFPFSVSQPLSFTFHPVSVSSKVTCSETLSHIQHTHTHTHTHTDKHAYEHTHTHKQVHITNTPKCIDLIPTCFLLESSPSSASWFVNQQQCACIAKAKLSQTMQTFSERSLPAPASLDVHN